MKNIDKIRQMSTWELAEFLHDVSDHATKHTVCERDCEKCDFSDSFCTSEIGEWLLEEASNG